MAVSRAHPGEVVDVHPLGEALATTKTTSLVKTEFLEVIRLVIPAGKEIPTHQVLGEITVQCLEGRIEFTSGTKQTELTAGQMLYLAGGEPHALKGIESSSVLVTILLD